MILFHGSNVNVTEIDLKQSKVGKDFGCGFYLTPIFEHALRQANRKTEQSLSGSPIVSKFDFDDSVLNSKVLCTKVFDGYL